MSQFQSWSRTSVELRGRPTPQLMFRLGMLWQFLVSYPHLWMMHNNCLCIRRIPVHLKRLERQLSDLRLFRLQCPKIHRMLGHSRLLRSRVLLPCGLVNGCRKSRRSKRDLVQSHVGPPGEVVDQILAAVMLGHGGLVPVFTVVQSSISSGTVHCAEIKGILRAHK